jgi:hypothetical protein
MEDKIKARRKYGKNTKLYKKLVTDNVKREHHRRYRRRCEDNIKIDFKERRRNEWIHTVLVNERRALINTVMKGRI